MDGTWTTDDLAFASFLVLKGHEIVLYEWRNATECFFSFRATDELRVNIIDYTGELALVNPREYIGVFAATRKEMFNKRPRRQPERV